MEPPPRSRIAGIACREASQWLFRFSATMRSNPSSVISIGEASPAPTLAPTLLWRMSSPP